MEVIANQEFLSLVDGGLTWVQVFDPDDFFGLISDNRIQQIIANPDDFDENVCHRK